MGGSQPVSFRDIKIAELMPIVRKIAGRICRRLPSYIDIDDLISAGHIAAIDCADKFDASQAATWKSFSSTRIHGAMIDHLREIDQVARSVRTRAKRLRESRERLKKSLGREGTQYEVAKDLGIQPYKLERYEFHAIEHRFVSFDAPLDDDDGGSGTTVADILADPTSPDKNWLNKRSLLQLLKHLPEREAKIVELYIIDGLKHHEIGKMLGVTESRICQLLGQAIARIKKKREGLTTAGELAPIIRPRALITRLQPVKLLPSSPIVTAPATVLVAIEAVVPPTAVAPASLIDQLAAIRARMYPPAPAALLREQLSRHLARLRAI